MAETVFTTQTPSVTTGDDNVYYTLCTRITVAADGAVTGIRYYMPDVAPTSITAALFARTSDASGTRLGTATFASTSPGWQTATFASPISVDNGADLYAAVWTDTYVYTGSFFASAGVTNGSLTAPQDDSVTPARNGRFKLAGAEPTYPDSGGGTCYFVDITFASDVTGTGTPTTGPGIAAGTGTVSGTEENTGTGTPATGPGTAAGTGAVSTSGTGTATTVPGAAAGAAAVSTSGTGTVASVPGTASGTGTVGVQGAGTSTSGPGVAAGTGTAFAGAVAALTTGPGAAAGTGALSTTGTGTPGTGSGTVAATGTANVTGTGTGLSGPGTVAGTGVSGNTGTGASTSGPGVVSGAGIVWVPGVGALVSSCGTASGVASTGAAHWSGTGTATTGPGVVSGAASVERWPGIGPPSTLPDLRRAMVEFLRAHPYADPALTVAGAVADDLPVSLLPYCAVFAPPGGPGPVWCSIAGQTLSVQVWAESEAGAWTACEMVRAMAHDAPGRTIGEVAVLSCVDVTGVGIMPDPGYPSLHRAVCTVDVTGRWAI